MGNMLKDFNYQKKKEVIFIDQFLESEVGK